MKIYNKNENINENEKNAFIWCQILGFSFSFPRLYILFLLKCKQKLCIFLISKKERGLRGEKFIFSF